MTDYYQCGTCGKMFEYRMHMKEHEQTAHNSSLKDHLDDKELIRLDGMLKALRRNSYDKNNSISDKTEQRTLRNRKVARKKLTDFTT